MRKRPGSPVPATKSHPSHLGWECSPQRAQGTSASEPPHAWPHTRHSKAGTPRPCNRRSSLAASYTVARSADTRDAVCAFEHTSAEARRAQSSCPPASAAAAAPPPFRRWSLCANKMSALGAWRPPKPRWAQLSSSSSPAAWCTQPAAAAVGAGFLFKAAETREARPSSRCSRPPGGVCTWHRPGANAAKAPHSTWKARPQRWVAAWPPPPGFAPPPWPPWPSGAQQATRNPVRSPHAQQGAPGTSGA
mmetsp:Transcript_33378/g.75415  ORF Transcript_33378/g.75415 Transcript_33378/m.75415 type:complete len:248 (+) Transcript_33378:796-1539(+)